MKWGFFFLSPKIKAAPNKNKKGKKEERKKRKKERKKKNIKP